MMQESGMMHSDFTSGDWQPCIQRWDAPYQNLIGFRRKIGLLSGY